jgi:hypothetical protein
MTVHFGTSIHAKRCLICRCAHRDRYFTTPLPATPNQFKTPVIQSDREGGYCGFNTFFLKPAFRTFRFFDYISPGETEAEYVALSCPERSKINRFPAMRGWSANDIRLAGLQIASRSIYSYSEYMTVSILRENSALCEMLGLNPAEITKDKPYHCACRLYDLHHELKNWLPYRVRTLFGQENKTQHVLKTYYV